MARVVSQARSIPPSNEELVSSCPADLSTATELTAYRSTWLLASREALGAAGYEARYWEAVRRIDREEEPGAEEALRSLLANTWAPVGIACVHYRACGDSGISESEMHDARLSAEGGQVRRNWHAQIVAAAQKPEVDAWSLIAQVPKWWPRMAQGGGVAVYRQGPTQARIEFCACSLLEIPFYRDSTKNIVAVLLDHFCKDLGSSVRWNPKQGQASFIFHWR
jgi:hypothetical protein